ncbi:hypothetical protein J7412_07850 [Shimia sp. R9_3]|nr:hypothetical protein [Shimia sp. R9_3]
MAHASKIATCCYCGTRAALVLRGDARHELACSNCGAPLHDLKHLRVSAVQEAAPRSKDKGEKRLKAKSPDYAAYNAKSASKPPKNKKRPKRKKKSTVGWFLKEAFDVIEDIFD